MYKMTINTEVAQCKSFAEARWVRNMLLHDTENNGFDERTLVIKPMNKLSYTGDYPWRVYNKIEIG